MDAHLLLKVNHPTPTGHLGHDDGIRTRDLRRDRPAFYSYELRREIFIHPSKFITLNLSIKIVEIHLLFPSLSINIIQYFLKNFKENFLLDFKEKWWVAWELNPEPPA